MEGWDVVSSRGWLVTLALKELQRRTYKTVKIGTLAPLGSMEMPCSAITSAKVTTRCCAGPRWDYTGCSLPGQDCATYLPWVRAMAVDGRCLEDRGPNPDLSTFKVTSE